MAARKGDEAAAAASAAASAAAAVAAVAAAAVAARVPSRNARVTVPGQAGGLPGARGSSRQGVPALVPPAAVQPADVGPQPPVTAAGNTLTSFPPEWWHFPVVTRTDRDCHLCAERGERRVTTRVKCETCDVFLCAKAPRVSGANPPADGVDNCYKIWHLASGDPRVHPRARGCINAEHNFVRARAEYDGTEADEYNARRRDRGRRKRRRDN